MNRRPHPLRIVAPILAGLLVAGFVIIVGWSGSHAQARACFDEGKIFGRLANQIFADVSDGYQVSKEAQETMAHLPTENCK